MTRKLLKAAALLVILLFVAAVVLLANLGAIVRTAVEKGGKWGFINERGLMVVEPVYDQTDFFSEGLAAVKMGEKWGYIDRMGKLVIPPRFDRADRFKHGLAIVIVKHMQGSYTDFRQGYIDKSGKYVWQATAE